mmetsp:Transcript_8104/g.17135  ORF Transcript_8104/g.17135 Transcript_8104/m.17135 type:complete len:174 (+) Transcript_8104:2337-2858(+)
MVVGHEEGPSDRGNCTRVIKPGTPSGAKYRETKVDISEDFPTSSSPRTRMVIVRSSAGIVTLSFSRLQHEKVHPRSLLPNAKENMRVKFEKKSRLHRLSNWNVRSQTPKERARGFRQAGRLSSTNLSLSPSTEQQQQTQRQECVLRLVLCDDVRLQHRGVLRELRVFLFRRSS